jgi:hypothetical protein
MRFTTNTAEMALLSVQGRYTYAPVIKLVTRAVGVFTEADPKAGSRVREEDTRSAAGVLLGELPHEVENPERACSTPRSGACCEPSGPYVRAG